MLNKIQTMEKKKSVGVTILATCILFSIIPGLIAAFIGAISDPGHPKNVFWVALDVIMRILFISSPVMFLVTGIGLLRLKNWARLTTIFYSPVLSYIVVGFAPMHFIKYIPSNIWPIIFSVGLIMSILFILFFLTRPKVKEQFK